MPNLTDYLTGKEIIWRDNFWRYKIPKNSPNPNFLTIARFIGSLFLLISPINKMLFLFVVIFLFLTDYFDGIVARTQNRETLFGKWADPIADRTLLVSVLYFLYTTSPSFWLGFLFWMSIPEVCILLIGIILILLKKTIIPRPNVWGRLKFTIYFLGIFFYLINFTLVSKLLISVAILFAFIAVINYSSRIYKNQ